MRLDELLAPRKTGKFYLGDDETPASRLARVLPAFGVEPEVIGAIVEAYYADRQESGPTFTLRKVTKTENDKLREIAKKTERKFDQVTKQWSGGDVDQGDYILLRVAYAVTEPEIPGDDLRAKAAYLADNMDQNELMDLYLASIELGRFNLSRAQDLVKN